jgi:hypothetical protein
MRLGKWAEASTALSYVLHYCTVNTPNTHVLLQTCLALAERIPLEYVSPSNLTLEVSNTFDIKAGRVRQYLDCADCPFS